MRINWWRRWATGRHNPPHQKRPLNSRPWLEPLESVIAPALLINTATITPAAVDEGGIVTLNGTYTATNPPVGSLQLVIVWGDNSSDTLTLNTIGNDIPFSKSHTYLDDDPPGTSSDVVNVSVTLADTGPSVVSLSKSGFEYRAYDIPGLGIDLAAGFATPGNGGVTKILDNNDESAVDIALLGSQFTLYGQSASQISISENGIITVSGTPVVTTGNDTALSSKTQALVAPFWDDLQTNTGLADHVYYRFTDLDGNGSNDYLIVEWSSVPHFNGVGSATFQALLQLNTGATNGDIIFNYIDTDFGSSSINFGASATVGIRGEAGKPNTGVAEIPNPSKFCGNGQAVRFSSQSTYTAPVTITASPAPTDAFGYGVFRHPFEARLDLQPSAMNVALNVPFDSQVVSVANILGGNSFNFYGTILTGGLNIGANGLIVVNGVSGDGPDLNKGLDTTPGPQTIAPLWDNWVGLTGGPARVLFQLVDLDGTGTADGGAEFLIVEWSQLLNNNYPNPPGPAGSKEATFQAILELNTGADPGEIYFNYVNTDVTFGTTKSFNNGASATVGIKDTGTQGSRRLVIQSSGAIDNDKLAPQRAILIAQTGSSSKLVPVTVNNVAPTIVANGNTPLDEGSPFNLSVVINDPSDQSVNGDSFTVTVDFGDKTGVMNMTIDAGKPRSLNLSHTYADNGTYPVIVTAKDDDLGVAVPQTVNVNVNNVAPTITFIAADQLIRPGFSINLMPLAKFTDPGFSFPTAGTVETFTYTINWGDGQTTSKAVTLVTNGSPGVLTMGTINETHPYVIPGSFTVIVSISDDDGGTVVGSFDVGVGSPSFFVIGADAGSTPTVRAFDSKFKVQQFQFDAYDGQFRGGVRVASGDVTGDGLADVVTAAGPSGGPHVKVFEGATGDVVRSFFAYSPAFTGGVYLAIGDVNHDGRKDIITGAGQGGGPHVRIFSGVDGSELFSFFAYSPAFSGGVRVASADLDGDLFDDIITGAGPSGGPHVIAYSGKTGGIITQFFAYDVTFSGGVFVAAGNVTGTARPEIVTGPGVGGGPLVRVFDGLSGFLLNQYTVYPPGTPGSPPFTGDALWASGVRVALTDIGVFNPVTMKNETDGVFDLIVGPGPGRQGQVKVFSGLNNPTQVNFVAIDPSFLGGVFVGGN